MHFCFYEPPPFKLLNGSERGDVFSAGNSLMCKEIQAAVFIMIPIGKFISGVYMCMIDTSCKVCDL
ncbi:MAG: hypothetical protein CYG59_16455 [Chloroflexi bacterium]|nr:MAG: hypothetical protein CYG59_16365 [Chloroflexota bacterium]PLS78840.1 MAG: hypothetical protein CYG59_16455 [Chloroflexota bacterium]